MSRELTTAEREFLGGLDADQRVILGNLQTEQRAYENVLKYCRENLTDAYSFAFGYLKDAVRHRTYEEIQAIERGLTRALQEVRP